VEVEDGWRSAGRGEVLVVFSAPAGETVLRKQGRPKMDLLAQRRQKGPTQKAMAIKKWAVERSEGEDADDGEDDGNVDGGGYCF
jgi:hypothetical protein